MKPVSEEFIAEHIKVAQRVAENAGLTTESLFLLLLLRTGMPPESMYKSELGNPAGYKIGAIIERTRFRLNVANVLVDMFGIEEEDIALTRVAYVYWCMERRHEYGE